MPIPDFQTLMLPLLESLAVGKERLMRDVTNQLADRAQRRGGERTSVRVEGGLQRFLRRG
jgi:restriction endonuclease Mrr